MQYVQFSFQKNATGKELFDKVCNYLTLQEKEYFGLQYVNNNVKVSLDLNLLQIVPNNQGPAMNNGSCPIVITLIIHYKLDWAMSFFSFDIGF